MVKKQITLIFLSLSMGMSAQDFSGKATYQTKKSFKEFDEKVAENPNKISEDLIDAVKKRVKKHLY